jgi:ribosomal protein L29
MPISCGDLQYHRAFGRERAALVEDAPTDTPVVKQLRAQLRTERELHAAHVQELETHLDSLLRELLEARAELAMGETLDRAPSPSPTAH